MVIGPFHHLSVSLRPCSGHQLSAAPASPSSRHPHGPARGPPPPPTAAAAAGVLALSTRSAVNRPGVAGRDGSGRRGRRGRCLGARAAAAAGASDPEAEAADPAADPHRRVPAAARAAVPPA